jgi:hypothetical protein
MQTMRMNHEKFFAERKSSWDKHLDRLSVYLDEHPEYSGQGGLDYE